MKEQEDFLSLLRRAKELAYEMHCAVQTIEKELQRRNKYA